MASRLDDLIREHAQRLDQLAAAIDLADVTRGRVDDVPVTLIDSESTPTQPEGRRRWPIIAVAAALVAIALGGVILVNGDEDPSSRVPTDQPSTSAPTTTLASVGRVGFVGVAGEGAPPSTPIRGEAVLSINSCPSPGGTNDFVGWNGELTLYADGRLIWRRYADLPEGANRMFTGYLEQRLTSEGVERMRSAVATSGRLRFGGQECKAGGYYVYVFEEPGSSLTTPPSELVTRLTDPASWLPADAWQDREIRAFVPSQYIVSMTTSPLHLENLALLPAETSQLLVTKEWGIQTCRAGLCYDTTYTSAEARALAAALDDAHLEQNVFVNTYLLQYQLPDESATIGITPVLPHDIRMGPRAGGNAPAPAVDHTIYCWDHPDSPDCP